RRSQPARLVDHPDGLPPAVLRQQRHADGNADDQQQEQRREDRGEDEPLRAHAADVLARGDGGDLAHARASSGTGASASGRWPLTAITKISESGGSISSKRTTSSTAGRAASSTARAGVP